MKIKLFYVDDDHIDYNGEIVLREKVPYGAKFLGLYPLMDNGKDVGFALVYQLPDLEGEEPS